MHVSVVIPAFNEERTIETLLKRVLEARHEPHQWEIIVVDDCSKDKTTELVKKFHPDVRLVSHEKNLGKGGALRTGFASVSGEVVLIQDADLEYDPNEYRKLLQPILDGVADVVWGSRFIGSEAKSVLYYWHYVGNKLITMVSNMLTNRNLSDMECGLVAIKTSYVKQLRLEERGFGNQPEMTAKLARLRARFYEVGVSYHGRTYEEGKKITWVHGFEALWCILKYGMLQRIFDRPPPSLISERK
jgi:glycosyltransferase involved in cell wall biosynthesis